MQFIEDGRAPIAVRTARYFLKATSRIEPPKSVKRTWMNSFSRVVILGAGMVGMGRREGGLRDAGREGGSTGRGRRSALLGDRLPHRGRRRPASAAHISCCR